MSTLIPTNRRTLSEAQAQLQNLFGQEGSKDPNVLQLIKNVTDKESIGPQEAAYLKAIDPSGYIGQRVQDYLNADVTYNKDPYRYLSTTLKNQFAGKNHTDLTDDELSQKQELLKALSNNKFQTPQSGVSTVNVGPGGASGQATFNSVTAPDYTNDIKEIQQELDARSSKATSDKAVTDYLSALPGQLKQSREDFLSGEVGRGQQQLDLEAPTVFNNANARGMLDSGQPADELSARAADISGSLAQERADLESNDNQFYFNAAYQNAVRKAVAASGDYSSSLQNQQQQVLTQRGQAFSSAQTGLNNTLQTQIARDDAQRQFMSQQAALQRERDQANRNRLGGIASGIGGAAGAIAGSAGGPAGVIAGSSVGSADGGALGGLD